MAANLTRLNVALTLTTGAFSRSTQSALKSAQAFGDGLKRSLLSPIGAIASALTAGSLIAGIKSASDRIDGLAKSADRLGMSTESLAGFRLAAEQTGGSVEQMEQAMGKLQVKVEAAASGNKAAADSFKALGLSVQELARLPIDQQMAKVSNAVAGMGTESQKTAAAVALFGESCGKMVGMLSLGSAGLEKATRDAEAMGLAVSRVDAAKVEEAKLAFDNVGRVIEGILNTIAPKIAPFVTAFSNAFSNAAKESGNFGSTIDRVIEWGIKGVGFLANAWQGLGLIWQSLKVGILRIGGAGVEMADSLVKAAQWIGAKFGQAWTLIGSAADTLWSALKVGWAAAKVPVYDFVQFVGTQMATMVRLASEAMMRIDTAVGVSMLDTANAIQVAVGAMGATARKGLEDQVKDLKKSAAGTAAATSDLFTDVATQGSETLRFLAQGFRDTVDAEMAHLEELRTAELASDRISAIAAQIQSEAQVKAEGRAAEIAAAQQHAQTLKQIEGDGLDWLRPAWMEYYDWKNSTQAQNMRQGMSAASNFFGNLSALTQSHNKRAKAIGEAAARAKIVTDTASAAMAAYASLAGIPIVGPGLGAAAAAAAIAAGAVQLGNVGKDNMGGGGTSNMGGPGSSMASAAPAQPTQTVILQGDSMSSEALVRIFQEAKEKGFLIDEVRRA
jgi:hypothetical protein